MKKKIAIFVIVIILSIGVVYMLNSSKNGEVTKEDKFNLDSTVASVENYEGFKDFGKLIFPVDIDIPSKTKLKDVGDYYIWYNDINPKKTVEIVNYLKDETDLGNKIFYDIYTDEEKKEDPSKVNTGLFFFRGKENAKTAIISAGGGMMYVGAMQDSFPHALELSKRGYNAFAIIYRPGYDTAPEDLARAIEFIHENAKELKIDVDDYSLWGGSAGARMAAWVGNGTEKYIDKAYPRPSAVIMEYTGLSDVTGEEPPTYNCVGTADPIASYKVMQERIDRIKANGTDAEIDIYKGLPHGFGIGEGTVAEGWIDNAINFWKRNMKS